MSVPAVGYAPVNLAADAAPSSSGPSTELSTRRLNIIRIGYLVMAIGLVLVKWPVFVRDGGVAALPLYEGVVAALLTALSLLAILGLRYPIKLLPVLLFESLWKLIWVVAVGVPHLIAGDLDEPTSKVFFSFFPIVIIVAVIPWDYVWKHYVRAPGAPWR